MLSDSPPSVADTQQVLPVVHVCVTCRRGGPAMDTPPGAQLYDRLVALLAQEEAHADGSQHCDGEIAGADGAPREIPVIVKPVECLAACDRGCTAAIAMHGRWTWLLGHLGPEKAEDLLVYARLYAASKKGTVMPSRRPASLSDMVLGRVPASLYQEQE
ncbi:DUF1636 domain-containing protein [Acetobacter indonesiensis]|nr:DUF1636 domain-containing protein [Acetobacter indonesiensis]MCP1230936.1 DUF1636 domain-containing protein [Acetobacter indonesiensis]